MWPCDGRITPTRTASTNTMTRDTRSSRKRVIFGASPRARALVGAIAGVRATAAEPLSGDMAGRRMSPHSGPGAEWYLSGRPGATAGPAGFYEAFPSSRNPFRSGVGHDE